jgi:hypothetical protein
MAGISPAVPYRSGRKPLDYPARAVRCQVVYRSVQCANMSAVRCRTPRSLARARLSPRLNRLYFPPASTPPSAAMAIDTLADRVHRARVERVK